MYTKNGGNNSVFTVKINNVENLRLVLVCECVCQRIKNILATEISKTPTIIEIVGVN